MFEWIAAAVLAVVVLSGLIQRGREFIINLCLSSAWTDYGVAGLCSRMRRLRRKYDFFKRLKQ